MNGHQKYSNKDMWLFHNNISMKLGWLLDELIELDSKSYEDKELIGTTIVYTICQQY